MSDMKFIRKGTGRPFPTGQFSGKELQRGALPGYEVYAASSKARIEVIASQYRELPFKLAGFSGEYYWEVAGGLDSTGRPSFLTVEKKGAIPALGTGAYYFSTISEGRVEDRMTLEQSGYYTDDLIADNYVAQWSLVKGRTRKGLRWTPALYELTEAYALSSYRSEGLMHICLGARIEIPTRDLKVA
jgi:hypothetical protein